MSSIGTQICWSQGHHRLLLLGASWFSARHISPSLGNVCMSSVLQDWGSLPSPPRRTTLPEFPPPHQSLYCNIHIQIQYFSQQWMQASSALYTLTEGETEALWGLQGCAPKKSTEFPFHLPVNFHHFLSNSHLNHLENPAIPWGIICDLCLVPATSSMFSVVPSSVPSAVHSVHPLARTELEPHGSLQHHRERGRADPPSSWGRAEKLRVGRKKIDLINPEKHCCSIKWTTPSLHLQKLIIAVCTAGAASGCSTWPNKHTGPVLSLLGQVHATVLTGGLFSLLCSYTPLKQSMGL